MFRKIVSHLSFSPSVIGQLGFYAKRLHKEEFARRLGLVFIALALVVQSVTIFSPPEAAFAANGTSSYLQQPKPGVVDAYGNPLAVQSVADLLYYYDNNVNNYRDIMDYAGITRQELASVKAPVFQTPTAEWANQYTWGFAGSWGGQFIAHDIRDANGNKIPKQVISINEADNSRGWRPGLGEFRMIGHSAKMGWFAINILCANLITVKMPEPKKPSGVCNALTVAPLTRNKFTLRAESTTRDGAQVAKNVFVVRDSNSTVVNTIVAEGNSTTVERELEIANPGNYTVQLEVHMSIGVITGDNCIKNISVAPEPKDIQVCDLTTKKVITIKENQFDGSKHSKNLDDCISNIQVCDLTTKKVITIKENQFDSKKHSKNLDDCKAPEPKDIQVCDLTTKKVITIKENQFDSKKHSKNLDDCVKDIRVCEIATMKVITIKENKFDSKKHSKNLDDCVKNIRVCEIATKKIITIKENQFDSKKHSANLDDCKVKTIPPCPFDKTIPSTSPDCQTCPGDNTMWIKDEDCVGKITRSKIAYNMTTNKNATEQAAKSNEVIEYRLTVENIGLQEASITVEDQITDVLEYAEVLNFNEGKLIEKEGKVISWGSITLKPGEKKTVTYSVKIKEKLPAQAQPGAQRNSQDCKITNTFGNTVTTDIECPTPKVVEQVVQQLPKTGAGANIIGAMVVAAIAVFFYARSRQLKNEVRLIRRDVNAGTI